MWSKEQVSLVRGGVFGTLLGGGFGGTVSGILVNLIPTLNAFGPGHAIVMVASGLYMGAIYGGLVGALIGGVRTNDPEAAVVREWEAA
jgi:TctA family transporter